MKTSTTGVEFFLFLANKDALQKFRQLRHEGGRLGSISGDLKEDPHGTVSSAFMWQGTINPLHWMRIEDQWRKHIKGA
jgi:hypothetical protein